MIKKYSRKKLSTILLSLLLLLAFSGNMAFAGISVPQKITTLTGVTVDPIYTRGYAFYNVDGDNFVWSSGPEGNRDIHYYNLSTGEHRQLTNAPGEQLQPVVQGNRVVWEDWRSGSPQIYMYDLSSNTETFLTDIYLAPGEQLTKHWKPNIFGDIVVWTDFRNGNGNANYDIYSFNIATGETRQISSSTAFEVNPQIYGNNIVYQRSGSNGFDLYLYDYASGQTSLITDAPNDQFVPSINANYIFWNDGRLDPNNLDIWYCDLQDKVEKVLISAPGMQTNAKNSGNRVIFQTDRFGSYDIAVYDLETGSTPEPIANSAEAEVLPCIDGDRVFWMQQNGTDWDVYTASFETVSANPTIQANITGQSAVYFNPYMFNPTQVTLNGADGIKAIYTTSPWLLCDGRGTGAGWYVAISATTPQTTGGQIIDLTNLRLYVNNVLRAADAQSSSDPNILSAANGVSLETAQTAISAPANEGMGSFNFIPTLELTIPSKAYAGNYNSTLYLSLYESAPAI